jgi:hypothetical protein
MARKFFYVCAGILMLVAASALRSNNVVAQVSGQPVVGLAYVPTVSPGYLVALTANGDEYRRYLVDGSTGAWRYYSNVLTGNVSSEASTLGDVKVKYR